MHGAVIASLNWSECRGDLSFNPAQGVTGSLYLREPMSGPLKVELQYQAEAVQLERLHGSVRTAGAISDEASLDVSLALQEDEGLATLAFSAAGPVTPDAAVIAGLRSLADWLTYAIARQLGKGWLLRVQTAHPLYEGVAHMAELAAASVEPCALVLLDHGD